jgi:hypothetical protein
MIRKQNVVISFEDTEEGIGMQNHIAEVFHERLKPAMEIVLDEEIGRNYFASVEKLEIDCGILSNKNWEQEWIETTLRKLRDALRTVNKRRIVPELPGETRKMTGSFSFSENVAESFLFFLRNGYLPWNNRIRSINEMESLIDIDDSLVAQLKELIRQYAPAAQRLVFRFSEDFRQKITNAFSKGREEYIRQIFSLLNDKGLVIEKAVADAAILYSFALADDEISREFFSFVHTKADESRKPVLEKILKRLTKTKNSHRNKGKSVPGKEDEKEIEQESIYINNAGIIILHPFLPELFEELQLMDKNEWTDEDASARAAMILEFLASGSKEFPEFRIPLNKILCGIEITEVPQLVMEIDEDIIRICNNLLTAVKRHWAILKNSSIDSLRETFFQRDGKLTRVDDGWYLQVEQKGVDILLSHLPWGIGTIKLPWMKEPLYTEW